MDEFTQYPTGNWCNAHKAVRALGPAVKPLDPARRVAGRAITARITPGQNAAIHKAVHKAQPGDLLVVDGGSSDRFGPFGDLLAECCQRKGIVGAVFDCTVRDSADIQALGFPVFCRGFHPEATAKTEPGETGCAVVVGGVIVRPGDIVVGDPDGVVVIPHEAADEALHHVREVAAREEVIRARIRAGETTFQVFGLDKH